ncbi:MAG: hypothetical protein A2X35_02265 [Elusimicrobia bacterium GWA2_61_42]|nr:MAG: hypothetical protein A2X35_02265 [Elusimicrobia bacterium GWA2_61_42]OGR75152.1 MAG: hypothetical protein A2X38_06475 [Elusimicrobia bacterium GWC2_61_25]
MPKFNFYSAWMDPVFYLWAAVAAAALFALVYSIRRYLELKNTGVFDQEAAPEDSSSADLLPTVDEQPELPVRDELPAPGPEPMPAPGPAAAEAGLGSNRAETFVRGIYEGISGLDSRLRGIEAAMSKGRVNNDFTVKFLEDILQDIDSLDKAKLKARIEYLLSDLKK